MNWPKMVLNKLSGDRLDWFEWSGQFIATIEQSGFADSVKMNHLKTLVTGRAKATIKSMEYSGQTYHMAWQTLAQDFGRSVMIENAQLRKIHAYPFIKPHGSLETMKYFQVVSGCVNVLTQFGLRIGHSFRVSVEQCSQKVAK